MHQIRTGLFGKVKFVVYLDNPVDKPNLTDVYLNVYDMVENDFLNNLAQAFSISGIENIGTYFFKSLGQDFLTIGQDIIDSQCEGVQDELFSKRETDDKLDETIIVNGYIPKDSIDNTESDSLNDNVNKETDTELLNERIKYPTKDIDKKGQTKRKQYTSKKHLFNTTQNKYI